MSRLFSSTLKCDSTIDILTQTFSGAKVKEGSLHISNPAVTQLFSELDYLRSNHSDVIEAEEEAKKALESAINNHKEVKVKIEQLKTVNDGYQKQMQALQVEKANLKSNVSALGEKLLSLFMFS